MVALREHTPSGMTVDEFLAWVPDDSSVRGWQLIDGEPLALAPARERHGAIHNEIGRLIGNHLAAAPTPCRVLTEPGIVPRVRANRNYRVPDLAIACSPPGNEMIVPEPTVLIEILSPSNEAATRANIWAYTTIPSVREILAVHTVRIEAELLRRNGDGSWPEEAETIGPDGTLTLPSVGFTVPLRAFYRTTSLG